MLTWFVMPCVVHAAGTVEDEAWGFVYAAFGKPLSDLEYEGVRLSCVPPPSFWCVCSQCAGAVPCVQVIAVAFGGLSLVNAQYPQNLTGDNRPVGAAVRP
jgi:hypothetical protein